MPYEEFQNWRTFYQLEPWGWHDREYRTASLLAMLVNINVKRQHRKNTDEFMRDMPKLIEKAYREFEYEQEMRNRYKTAGKAERAKMIARSLGGKVGNSRNNSRKTHIR